MNLVVLGAGAVGGYFGAKLARAGVPVTFLVREKRYQQLQDEGGMFIHSTYGDFELQPQLARSTNNIERVDVVLLSVKNYHLEETLPILRGLVDRGARVLPLLNGMEHISFLARELGAENVLGGLCFIEATLDSNGHILHTSSMHDIIFGSMVPMPSEWLQALERTLRTAEIGVRLSDSIRVDMWQKFIFLTSFSGITAATRKPIGDILGDSISYWFLLDVIEEVFAVAKAQCPELSDDTPNQMVERMHRLSPTMTSSLHRDLEKGLPLEIDSLQGAVLKMAKQHNIAVPYTRSVYAILHPHGI